MDSVSLPIFLLINPKSLVLMKIKHMDLFDLPSKWISASMFCGSVLAMFFSNDDDEDDELPMAGHHGSKSTIRSLFIWFFESAAAVFLVLLAILWVLYAIIAGFNLINYATEGFTLGPAWMNPPLWVFLIWLIPTPSLVYFLDFMKDVFCFWAKLKTERLFRG
jgi:hypothetical protein